MASFAVRAAYDWSGDIGAYVLCSSCANSGIRKVDQGRAALATKLEQRRIVEAALRAPIP
jgi:hypothetical protein